jgi:hypothetical protein
VHGGVPDRRYSELGQNPLRTLTSSITSGIRTRKLKSRISHGSHGNVGARKHLRRVRRVVCDWRIGLGTWDNNFWETTRVAFVMEELDLMCDIRDY